MTTGNASIVRRLMEEVWGRGDLSLIPRLVAEAYVGHLPIGDHYGPEGVRIDVLSYRAAFPDLVVSLDDLFVAVGDRVVRRFTLRGTRHRISSDSSMASRPAAFRIIAVDQLRGGQLIESWVAGDSFPQIPHE